jgi:hypothetical protein
MTDQQLEYLLRLPLTDQQIEVLIEEIKRPSQIKKGLEKRE